MLNTTPLLQWMWLVIEISNSAGQYVCTSSLPTFLHQHKIVMFTSRYALLARVAHAQLKLLRPQDGSNHVHREAKSLDDTRSTGQRNAVGRRQAFRRARGNKTPCGLGPSEYQGNLPRG